MKVWELGVEGWAEEVQGVSNMYRKRAQMDLGGYQLCQCGLMFLCLSFIMDKMVTIISTLQECKAWYNI